MKLNKNIIIAAIAGITTLSPIISQSSLVLADEQTNQTEQNNINENNNQNTTINDNTTQISNNNANNSTTNTGNPVVEPISQPLKEKDPEPKTNMRKAKKSWSKRHKKANKYYNKNVKKGKKLKNKKSRLKLYKKTLKHFKHYKTNYAKRFKKYLNAEIKWLKRQIKKDVPTTKPSGNLKPKPVNPPKKEHKHHEGWGDSILYDNYLNDYKYYKKHPKVNTPLMKQDINALKKRGYKFNADMSDKGYEAHNKKLQKRDNKLIDEGKLK